MPDIKLKAEVVLVREEVQFFRTECLPRFFATVETDALIEWQCAADRLAIGLTDKCLEPLRIEDYEQFLFQPAEGSYSCRQGRIIWEFSLFTDLKSAWPFAKSVLEEAPPVLTEMRNRLTANIEALKRWLLGLDVKDAVLWNALCSVLPNMAEHDPAFAKRALDPTTWKEIVKSDARRARDEGDSRVRFIEGAWFAHILNNALLHVLGALANNHFMAISSFLDHPHLFGRYTWLMPHYLFAVLFRKVKALRNMAGIERCEVLA